MLDNHQNLGLLCCTIAALALAMLWLGCAGGQYRMTVSTPEWFENIPEDPQYFYSASTASHEDRGSAIKKAEENGRGEIARQVRVRVKSMVTSFDEQTKRGEDVQMFSKFDSVSQQVVSEILNECITVKQMRQEGNIYHAYVLMKIPKQKVDDTLISAIWNDKQYSESEQSAVRDAVCKSVNSLVANEATQSSLPVAMIGIFRSGVQDEQASNLLDAKLKSFGKFTLDPKTRNMIRGKTNGFGDYIDREEAIRISKKLGFGRVIYGDIRKLKREKQQLHLVIAEVEKMESLWEKTFTGYPDRSRALAVTYSLVPKIAGGQWYNFRPKTAIGLSLLEIIGIVSSVYRSGKYGDVRDKYDAAQKRYRETDKLPDMERYRDTADGLYADKNVRKRQMGLAIGLTAALYLGRICLAYLDSWNYQRKRCSGEQTCSPEFLDYLIDVLLNLCVEEEIETIAIVNIFYSEEVNKTSLHEGVIDQVKSEFIIFMLNSDRLGSVKILDRSEEYLKAFGVESGLTVAGFITQETALEVGEMLGAQSLLSGRIDTINKQGDNVYVKVYTQVRIAKTGEMLFAGYLCFVFKRQDW